MGCAVDYADLFTWTVRPGCARKDLGSIPPDVTCALRTDAGSLRNARCVSSRASTANAHSGDCTLRVPCEPQQIYATDSALLGRMRNYAGGFCLRTGLETGTNRFMRFAPLSRGTQGDALPSSSDAPISDTASD